MKRIICILLCLLLFAGSGAFAFWTMPHPLDYAPPYDLSSGILSGSLIWTDTDRDNHDLCWLKHINLKTGKKGQVALEGHHYLVYSDLPGAVVAKEADGKLFLYQIDADENISPILEADFPIEPYTFSGLPTTVYAYYEGWIYFNSLNKNNSRDTSLFRMKPDGKQLFAYRVVPSNASLALAPNGMIAWFENTLNDRKSTTLFIQNPDDGTVLEIPFTGEYAELNPMTGQPVWKDADTLVFCSYRKEKEVPKPAYSDVPLDPPRSYPLYGYHLSSQKISPVKRKNGSHIVLPYGFEDRVCLNRDQSQLYVGSVQFDVYDSFVVDISTGEYYNVSDLTAIPNNNRVIWYFAG